MRWIRNPTWDSVWILSGVPIGLSLLILPLRMTIAAFFILNSAHLISPVIAAWSNSGFRRIIRQHQIKYVVFPALILGATICLGLTVGKVFEVNPVTMGLRVYDVADYQRPFVIMFLVYFVWNIYHFGSQNFGIMSLYWCGFHGRTRRHAVKWACILVTTVGMSIIPRVLRIEMVSLFAIGFFACQHSLASIGLCGHVIANRFAWSPWLIAAGLIMLGASLFCMTFGMPWAPTVTMTAVGFRIGLGFVHFLYDRWLWKLSDPEVRAAIGKELFACPAMASFK